MFVHAARLRRRSSAREELGELESPCRYLVCRGVRLVSRRKGSATGGGSLPRMIPIARLLDMLRRAGHVACGAPPARRPNSPAFAAGWPQHVVPRTGVARTSYRASVATARSPSAGRATSTTQVVKTTTVDGLITPRPSAACRGQRSRVAGQQRRRNRSSPTARRSCRRAHVPSQSSPRCSVHR